MIGSEFGMKFASDISQVSGLDVLIDDRINRTIGKRDKDHILLGIPYIVILGKRVLDPIPKFEVVSSYDEDHQARRKILTHSEVIHFFRLLRLNSM